MALKRNEKYPGRFDNPTTSHPQGAFKNRSAPNANDGSYLEKDWANDWDGFFSSLLSAAALTANGTVDSVGNSQYFDALIASVKANLGTAAQRNVGVTGNQIPDITSFLLNFNASGGTGIQYLPSGLILQWGVISPSAGDVTTTFPVAFPNNCLLGIASVAYTPGSASIGYVSATATSRTQIVSRCSSVSLGCRFWAVGN